MSQFGCVYLSMLMNVSFGSECYYYRVQVITGLNTKFITSGMWCPLVEICLRFGGSDYLYLCLMFSLGLHFVSEYRSSMFLRTPVEFYQTTYRHVSGDSLFAIKIFCSRLVNLVNGSVHTVDSLRASQPRNRGSILSRMERFVSSSHLPGRIWDLLYNITGFSLVLNLTGCETNHSSQSGAEVKMSWTVPSYVFMDWCLIKYRWTLCFMWTWRKLIE
jgi:hypothetical protein